MTKPITHRAHRPTGRSQTSETARIGRAPCPDRAQRLREVVALCDQRPMTRAELRAALDVKESTLCHWLQHLHQNGRIEPLGRGAGSAWVSAALAERMQQTGSAGRPRRAAIDPVRLPDRTQWLMPAAEVILHEGVRITRQAAPRGRFEARLEDLPATGGVISHDWQLRRAQERAQARAARRVTRSTGASA